MVRNPHAKPNRVLGLSDAEWLIIKTAVENYCKSNPDKQDLDEATIRALDVHLANDRTWGQIKTELGL